MILHRRRFVYALLLGTVLAVLLSALSPVLAQYDDVRADTLRLHILANSDSPQDQADKLAVRDAILAAEAATFRLAESKQDALAIAEAALPAIRHIAEQTLRARGSDAAVTARLENRYFATKDYGEFTLPAGRYDAVRVEIGEHKGKNWFCVMFPPLCVPAAEDADDGPAYSEEEDDAVRSPYKVKFAVVEAVERVKEWLSE